MKKKTDFLIDSLDVGTEVINGWKCEKFVLDIDLFDVEIYFTMLVRYIDSLQAIPVRLQTGSGPDNLTGYVDYSLYHSYDQDDIPDGIFKVNDGEKSSL